MNHHKKNSYHFLTPAAIRGATCLLAFSFCSLSQAATAVFVQTNGSIGFQSKSAISGSLSASSGGTSSSNSGFSTAETASARFGVLRVYSESHAPVSSGSFFGNAHAYFRDDYLFDAPGKTGQAGTFTFSLRIDGSLSVALKSAGFEDPNFSRSYSFAALSLESTTGAFPNGNRREQVYADGSTKNLGDPFLNLTSTFTIPFTFGTPFELKVSLQAQTNARAQFGSDSISDLGHTLEWDGIVSVNDGGNNPVGNYMLTTGSGTDYTRSIPEPGTCILTAGGLLTFLGTRRVRRRTQGWTA